MAPAMAAEEAAVKGEAAGGRPQVGAPPGGGAAPDTRGVAPGRARERTAGVASPGGHALLGGSPPARYGFGAKVVPWATHRCGAAPRRAYPPRERSPPAFGLPAARFLCPRLHVLAKVSWEETLHPVMASSRPPPTTGSPPRCVQGLLRALLEFSHLLCKPVVVSHWRSSGYASPSTRNWK